MLKRYTKDVHMSRLSKMMNTDDFYCRCPATPNYSALISAQNRTHLWKLSSPTEICTICRETVGLPGWGYAKVAGGKCPCNVLGKIEAKIRTMEALEEYYAEG